MDRSQRLARSSNIPAASIQTDKYQSKKSTPFRCKQFVRQSKSKRYLTHRMPCSGQTLSYQLACENRSTSYNSSAPTMAQ